MAAGARAGAHRGHLVAGHEGLRGRGAVALPLQALHLRAAGRGRVSLWTNSGAWHSKRVELTRLAAHGSKNSTNTTVDLISFCEVAAGLGGAHLHRLLRDRAATLRGKGGGAGQQFTPPASSLPSSNGRFAWRASKPGGGDACPRPTAGAQVVVGNY